MRKPTLLPTTPWATRSRRTSCRASPSLLLLAAFCLGCPTTTYAPADPFAAMLITKPVTATVELKTKMADGSIQNVETSYTLPAGTYAKLLSPEQLAALKAAATRSATAPAK